MVLIAGFAAADALRGRAERSEPAAAASVPPSPRRQAQAPPGWPTGVLAGSLVFTDASDCRVRAIGLADGTERRLGRLGGDCQLWAPPATDRVAYGLAAPSVEGVLPFRLADLAHPERELGGAATLSGAVVWSRDGQRVAWCERRQGGFDLTVGKGVRRLPRCPAAYTPDGRIAYAVGDRLVVDGRTVLRTDGGITFVRYGADGSLVIVVAGTRMERYDADGRLDGVVSIPEGRTPILSPKNCAAAFRPRGEEGPIGFAAFDCFRGRRPHLSGRDATWSPDGVWLAVAGRDAIVFDRIVGFRLTIRWPAAAAELAWRAP